MKQWIEFYRKAKTIYQTHSPFLYEFYTNVLPTNKEYYAFAEIEKVRKQLKDRKKIIDFTEYGAGSRVMKGDKRFVSKIARSGISDGSRCRNLFNLVNYLSPWRVLEFGTSLGVSTMYLAAARKSTIIDTVEVNDQLVEIAKENAQKLALSNINFYQSKFEDFINTLNQDVKYNIVYLDGNHTFEATTDYFQRLLPHMAENCVVVVDDIHWSEGMYKAYEVLNTHERVFASVETAFVGYLFLDNKYPKAKHTHIDYWLKPWQIGLFPQNV